MTAFRHGRTRSHVMEWDGGREQWEALCNQPSLAVRPAAWQGRDEWPMHYDVEDRRCPWCKVCVRTVRRRVDLLIREVLLPESDES